MSKNDGFPFDRAVARRYTPGRIVRVVNNEGLITGGTVGSLGVVYATFKDESAPESGVPFGGFAVLFEHGLVEGFSLEQAAWWLEPTAAVDSRLVNYHFAGLESLLVMFTEGYFKPTFDLGRRPFCVIPGGLQ